MHYVPMTFDTTVFFIRGRNVWDMSDLRTPHWSSRNKNLEIALDLSYGALWPRQHQGFIMCTDPSFGAPSLQVAAFGYTALHSIQKWPLPATQVALVGTFVLVVLIL